MRTRTLLIAGLVLVATSLIGPAVETSVTGGTVWTTNDTGWLGHMSGYGHMGWWGEGRTTGDAIEGAADREVTATEFAFSPAELTVMGGEAVNLILVNTGDAPHDLVIPGLDVHVAAEPGQRGTTGIEIERAGSYEFRCTYPGHAESGMTGSLTVVPNA